MCVVLSSGGNQLHHAECCTYIVTFKGSAPEKCQVQVRVIFSNNFLQRRSSLFWSRCWWPSRSCNYLKHHCSSGSRLMLIKLHPTHFWFSDLPLRLPSPVVQLTRSSHPGCFSLERYSPNRKLNLVDANSRLPWCNTLAPSCYWCGVFWCTSKSHSYSIRILDSEERTKLWLTVSSTQ